MSFCNMMPHCSSIWAPWSMCLFGWVMKNAFRTWFFFCLMLRKWKWKLQWHWELQCPKSVDFDWSSIVDSIRDWIKFTLSIFNSINASYHLILAAIWNKIRSSIVFECYSFFVYKSIAVDSISKLYFVVYFASGVFAAITQNISSKSNKMSWLCELKGCRQHKPLDIASAFDNFWNKKLQ